MKAWLFVDCHVADAPHNDGFGLWFNSEMGVIKDKYAFSPTGSYFGLEDPRPDHPNVFDTIYLDKIDLNQQIHNAVTRHKTEE